MTRQDGAGDASDRQRDWQRRRYVADVFGELLPETTSDDRVARRAEDGGGDHWYRSNRPPHHEAGS